MTTAALAVLALAAGAGWAAWRRAVRDARGLATERDRHRAFLDVLVQTSGQGVALLDAAGRIVAANHEFTRLGLPPGDPGDALGRPDVRDRQGLVVPPEAWPVARVLRGETFTRLELQLSGPGTQPPRVVAVSGAPVEAAGAGGVVVARDLTGERDAGRDARRTHELQAIGLVAAGVAHDFNNTLTVVLGNASLLRQAADRHPELLHDVEGLTAAARRASVLTRRLLALTRRESPGVERVRPGAIVLDLAPLLRRLLPSGATLDVVDETGDGDEVLCDPRSLELALVGLIGGARPSVLRGGPLRLVCDAGEFLEPRTLLAERLVRISLEGPAAMLDDDATSLWRLVTALPPDGPAAGGTSAYQQERLPGGRALVRLLLTAASTTGGGGGTGTPGAGGGASAPAG